MQRRQFPISTDPIGDASLGPGLIRAQLDDGVQGRVHDLDAVEVGIDQLDR